MSIEVMRRIKALEARVAALESKPEPVAEPKKMCPKCGEKPAYFFHVKNCAGKNKKNGDDRIRDPGAT